MGDVADRLAAVRLFALAELVGQRGAWPMRPAAKPHITV